MGKVWEDVRAPKPFCAFEEIKPIPLYSVYQ
jgi:hypothetical protein